MQVWLREQGADDDAQDDAGATPEDYAAFSPVTDDSAKTGDG